MLTAVTMFLGTGAITANAQVMLPDWMEISEDGRIKVTTNAGNRIENASG